MNSVTSGIKFYAYDGNANVAALVGSTGGIVAAYDFDPFGGTMRLSGSSARENPYRYSTKRANDSSEILLYEYRGYKPVVSRWLSRDRIEEDGGANLYAFVLNSPISSLDLLGEKGVPGATPIDPFNPPAKDLPCCCTPPARVQIVAHDAGSGRGQFRMALEPKAIDGCISDFQIRWKSCWRGNVCWLLPDSNDKAGCSFPSTKGNTHYVEAIVRWLSCKDGKWTPEQIKFNFYCRVEPDGWLGFWWCAGTWICD